MRRSCLIYCERLARECFPRVIPRWAKSCVTDAPLRVSGRPAACSSSLSVARICLQPVAKSTEFDNAIKPTFKADRRARKTRGSYDPAGGEVEPKCIDFAKLRVAFG